MKEQVGPRLRKVFSLLFNIDENEIIPTSSKDSIDNWDSLQHLNLVTSIEQEFQIILDESDVLELLSFELAEKIVIQRQALP